MRLARPALAPLLAVAACAHDVRAEFPALPEEPTGTLVLRLSQPATGVSVAVNGVLVVDDAHTDRIVIEHVPVGTADIVVAGSGLDREVKQWIGGDHATTIPLGVPAESFGFAKQLVGSLITIVVYSLLHP